MAPSMSSMSLIRDSLAALTLRQSLILGFGLRMLMILYSVWHDSHSTLKYTDIDYFVFTDAAKFLLRRPLSSSSPLYLQPPTRAGTFSLNTTQNVAAGSLTARLPNFLQPGDPYQRETYRYTPLLALLLVPNHILWKGWGKVLFSLGDLAVGWAIKQCLDIMNNTGLAGKHEVSSKQADQLKDGQRERQQQLLVNLAWILNPMVINISTRGSSESLIGVIIFWTLLAVEHAQQVQNSTGALAWNSWDWAAVGLGLATHWKIYPFVYGAAIWARIDAAELSTKPIGGIEDDGNHSYYEERATWLKNLFKPTIARLRFIAISFSVFCGMNFLMYLIWGPPFLQHTYFYHLHRLDHRHNFSSYFYPIYLSTFFTSHPASSFQSVFSSLFSPSNPLIAFIPQLATTIGLGVIFGSRKDVPMAIAWFFQTFAFVLFNKVCTSQYFIWYLWFLPILLIHTRQQHGYKPWICIAAVWIASQALWLALAYQLEMLGRSVFFELWITSIFHFGGNVWVFSEISRLVVHEKSYIDHTSS